MQGFPQVQLQTILKDVVIQSNVNEEGGHHYAVHYDAAHVPMAAVAIYLLSPQPKPVVDFLKTDDLKSHESNRWVSLQPR